jgi:hypothetical protein
VRFRPARARALGACDGRAQSEQMRRSLVNRVVLPSSGLLHSDSPPFLLGQKTVLWALRGHVLWQDYMSAPCYNEQTFTSANKVIDLEPIFVNVVGILLAVLNVP